MLAPGEANSWSRTGILRSAVCSLEQKIVSTYGVVDVARKPSFNEGVRYRGRSSGGETQPTVEAINDPPDDPPLFVQ